MQGGEEEVLGGAVVSSRCGSIWTASGAGFRSGLRWALSQQGAEVKRVRGRKVEALWCDGVV
jgi:hypothetical protein